MSRNKVQIKSLVLPTGVKRKKIAVDVPTLLTGGWGLLGFLKLHNKYLNLNQTL